MLAFGNGIISGLMLQIVLSQFSLIWPDSYYLLVGYNTENRYRVLRMVSDFLEKISIELTIHRSASRKKKCCEKRTKNYIKKMSSTHFPLVGTRSA